MKITKNRGSQMGHTTKKLKKKNYVTQVFSLGLKVEVTPGGKVGFVVALVVVVGLVTFVGVSVALVVGLPKRSQVHTLTVGLLKTQALVAAKLAFIWKILVDFDWFQFFIYFYKFLKLLLHVKHLTQVCKHADLPVAET
jgi:hypothetical protein